MILFTHPTGNENVRNAALAFAEAGMLAEFWTCVSWNPESPLNRLLPDGIRRQLCRRALPELLRNKTRHFPWWEAGRMLASHWGLTSLTAREKSLFGIDTVYRTLDQKVANRCKTLPKEITAVYAYEDGAAATFALAKKHGLKRIYDLPIGYWRAAHQIYAEEKERQPEWAITLTGALDSPEKLARKDEEIALADSVMVASSFTKKTTELAPGIEDKPVHIIPYGSPVSPQTEISGNTGNKLRVLFVGSLGQRKGLSYLLEAALMLKGAVELTLLGTKTAENCAPLNQALKEHRWIPTLPHDGVLQLMAQHDVFVFPSLFEGFGLVLLEAMSRGLPVIATAHTAAPDLINEGESGFIVPIRSAQAIAEKLDLLAHDSGLLSAMKTAALETAIRFTWEQYRARLLQIVLAETHR